ncbi:4-hydroxybenzoate octaprenyltransferase [Neisseria sp. Ec49-e6-T10]|uniref:4-hydroxybenzoate octaprenyltransferase n=1 Tax=Neisseria sp. Ec49-e6-T10 TaxID=3140744 RepID=UPI003EB8F253
MNQIKAKLKIYGELMRVEKPIGTLLLLWPTLWAWLIAGNGHPSWIVGAMLVLGTFLMRSVGCIINDVADRKIDLHVQRTQNRPFARGVVCVKEALTLAFILTILAILCLLPLNLLSWLLSIPAFFLAVSYPFTKRFFPLPQAYLGLAFSFGIPIAFAAQVNAVPLLAWLIFLANTAWTIAYDTIYALVDKEDDLKIGIQTSAITFGQYDIAWIMFFHILFLFTLIAIGLWIPFSWPFWISIVLVFLHQAKQYIEIKTHIREKCFKAFLDNNHIGFFVFIGILAHYLVQ